MKRQVYEINENGYIAGIRIAEFDSNGNIKETLPENYINTDPPQGLYRAKWTGAEWIEDMAQEVIDELNNVIQEPTELEELANYVLDVDFRVIMLEMSL